MLTLRTFNIERLTTSETGSKKKAFVDQGTIISGYLETASPEFAAVVEGQFGKIFSLFSDDLDADVKIGDRLIDTNGGDQYDAKGVLRNTDGPGRKLQITLTLAVDQ